MKRPRGVSRMLSSGSIHQMQVESNKNVDWMQSRLWWPIYISMIMVARVLSLFLPMSSALQWTVVNVFHAVCTYWSLHFNRGSPVWEDQGEHIQYTVWEQIDNGVPWTATRKFFIIVQLLLYLLVCYETGWELSHLIVNTVFVAISIIVKLPELHGVRIFNINGGPSSQTQQD